MNKKISILGKKVPILAIFMAVLIIGTASAAIFTHYATLDGNIEVTSPVFVTGVEIGGSGNLEFGSPASFEISNDGDIPVIVELATTVTYTGIHEAEHATDSSGVYVDYDVIENGDIVEQGDVLVPPGGLTVHVNFDTDEFIYPGTYNVQVEVKPYSGVETYESFGGNNGMVTLELIHKYQGGEEAWESYGNPSLLDFVPMGNEFYYELDATDLESEVEYALIYYADQDNRFVNWGGLAPGVIDTFTADGNGNVIVIDCIDLNRNMPTPGDANYPYAKIWIVPTDSLTDGDKLPMIGPWEVERYLFENSLVQYTDTNIVS